MAEQMSDKPWCPMSFNKDGLIGSFRCQKDNTCAWYDDYHKCCSVVTTAFALDSIWQELKYGSTNLGR